MRESWNSRYGLILAAAGNAVGIGNLLRFPGQAAKYGGGAFILPYLISLLVFGLPMMWIAWTLGRYGARFGHGTTPGIFDKLTKWRGAKYLGVLGVAIPLVFCFYYTYLEAWCLAYAYFSAAGTYENAHLPTFLNEFQGTVTSGNYFPSTATAFGFLVVTLALNVWVLYRGVARGIERLARIAMPLLFVFCVIMCIRVFSLPDAKGSVSDGLGYLWNPNFEALGDPSVWLAAAGQVFFTLSIGFGSLEVYASYLKQNDDVVATGLATASTNEFVEIIFGSMIAIPAAAVFFGTEKVAVIAQSGTFNIGMVSMPEILRSTGHAASFGSIWFLLLFFAAFTSSVAVCQPVVAFLQDEAKLPRGVAAAVVGGIWLLGSIPVVFFQRYGFLDELDFWAGTLGLVLFSAMEAVLFAWVFCIGKGWEELHRGALMRVPRVFRFLMRYVTPAALMVILAGWAYNDVIVQGKLAPKPVVHITALERSKLPGEFTSPAVADADKAEHSRITARLSSAAEAARRDLTGWATIELGADGSLEVVSLEGHPLLVEALPAADFARQLRLEKLRYEEEGAPKAARYTVIIEALHTAPYVWMARGIILAIIAMFAALVGVIWRQRALAESSKEEKQPETIPVEEGA